MTAFLCRRLAIVCAALLLSSCHYSDEEKWSVCCFLNIVQGATSVSAGQATILNWHRSVVFDGDGKKGQGPYGEGKTFYNSKDDKIRLELAEFLADHPASRAPAYFASLGMACGSSPIAPKDGLTRCQIELPVTVRCLPTYLFLPGTTPIPQRLQAPRTAMLQVRLSASAGDMTEISSRIVPMPGEQLCHR